MGHIAWLAAAHGAHSLAPRHRDRGATSSSYQPFILPFIQSPWLRARSSSLMYNLPVRFTRTLLRFFNRKQS